MEWMKYLRLRRLNAEVTINDQIEGRVFYDFNTHRYKYCFFTVDMGDTLVSGYAPIGFTVEQAIEHASKEWVNFLKDLVNKSEIFTMH